MKKSTLLFLVFAIVSITIGCHSGPPSNPNQGFLVIGQARVFSASNPYLYVDYATGGRYQGQFQSGAGTYGTVPSFDVLESFSTHNVAGAKVPGNWNLSLGSSFSTGSLCLGTGTSNVNVNLGSQVTVTCPGGVYAFAVQPDSMDAFNPPATVTISGSGIEDTYGMPTIAIYDEFGNVAASATATQTLAGGSPHSGPGIDGLTFNGINLSQVYDGTYSLAVNNVNSNGTWTTVGAGMVTVYGNPPPPPDLGGGGGGGGCEPQPRDQEQLECPPIN